MSLSGGKRIVVGVSGGIAAYKACSVVRQLTEAGHDVRVVPTESALRFVGAATFEALSGEPVHTGVFEDVPGVPHVQIGKSADLVVVAPATADVLARAARCCSHPRCTPRCGCIRRPPTTSRPCVAAARWCSSPLPGG